jgi:hypothetical protein
MNAAVHPAGSGSSPMRMALWTAAAALAVSLAAVSSQSLWIDESLTALKAAQTSFHDWGHAMAADRSSDLQMPLYMFYVWAFAKIIGTSEWALRAVNIPWFVAGVVAFVAAVPPRHRRAMLWVALASPFAWYYLDEARPYAMQVGAGFAVVAALFALKGSNPSGPAVERIWMAVLLIGLLALAGSSLLGMIWVGGLLSSSPWLFSRARLEQLARSYAWAGLLTVCLLSALAGYYLWTIRVGARASAVGSTDLRNLAFIGYELLGFGGLGPGRLELRSGQLAVFIPYVVPLALYGVAVCGVLFAGCRDVWRESSKRTMVALALAVLLPCALLIGAGWWLHFRVLARHFAPVLPLVLFVLARGVEDAWSKPSRPFKLAVVGFCVLTLASCASIRFAARHGKDDYRTAAGFANQGYSRGQIVWWNASREGALYYHVALPELLDPGALAVPLANPPPELLDALPVPRVIIVSRPDVYDGAGAIAAYLRRGQYTQTGSCRAFSVWERRN